MRKYVKKAVNKMKNVKINWFHLLTGIFVVGLVIISYFYMGNIDTTESTITENDMTIDILGFTIDFKTFGLFSASAIIGLLDGFNPCAMWVLIYLISLASTIGDRKKMYLIVGTFVATEAIMYFIVLAGWMNFFMFVGISTWILYAVGAFAIYTGIMSVKNYYDNGGEVSCEVGDAGSKKKTMNKIQNIVDSPITILSLFSVIALAIAINAIEFVCSAGLPAIFTQLIAVADVSLGMKYFYIFVYDFFFMLDDFIVFGLALWAANSDWMNKYSGYSKLFGGVIMVLIGIYLLFFYA